MTIEWAALSMITRIHHVQITVPPESQDIAKAFYCGLLGLPEIDKPDQLRTRGGFWVRVGEAELHVGVEEGVDRQTNEVE